MPQTAKTTTSFSALQIDIARHATDDFNPFHDKLRWDRIRANPFSGPLVLGFQSIAFMDNALQNFRRASGETELINQQGLRFSNFEVRFINAITADQAVEFEIRKSNWSEEKKQLRNRIVMRVDDRIVLTGHKVESARPALDVDFGVNPAKVSTTSDRDFIANTDLFLKRKFMMTSNAKNFLAASAVEPATYVDEIIDLVNFPESYPLSLISCALLECGIKAGHDFVRDPMVYAYHRYSTDRHALATLRSNEPLDIIVRQQPSNPDDKLVRHNCVAYRGNEKLFTAETGLMPLTGITEARD
jgi:hypothetical protein